MRRDDRTTNLEAAAGWEARNGPAHLSPDEEARWLAEPVTADDVAPMPDWCYSAEHTGRTGLLAALDRVLARGWEA